MGGEQHIPSQYRNFSDTPIDHRVTTQFQLALTLLMPRTPKGKRLVLVSYG
jgi:hypothetical protein